MAPAPAGQAGPGCANIPTGSRSSHGRTRHRSRRPARHAAGGACNPLFSLHLPATSGNFRFQRPFGWVQRRPRRAANSLATHRVAKSSHERRRAVTGRSCSRPCLDRRGGSAGNRQRHSITGDGHGRPCGGCTGCGLTGRCRREQRPAGRPHRFRAARRTRALAARLPARRRGLRHGRVRAGCGRHGGAAGAGCGGKPRLHARRRQRLRHRHRARGLRLARGGALGRPALVRRGALRPRDARHRCEPGEGLRRQQRRHGAVCRRRTQRARRQQRVREPRDHVRGPRLEGAGERRRRAQVQGGARRLRRRDRPGRRFLGDRPGFALQPAHHARHADGDHRARARPRPAEDRRRPRRHHCAGHLEQLRQRAHAVGHLSRLRGEF